MAYQQVPCRDDPDDDDGDAYDVDWCLWGGRSLSLWFAIELVWLIVFHSMQHMFLIPIFHAQVVDAGS
jgi:hypothetical protein